MKNMKLKVLLVLCALLLLSAFIAERKDPITIFMIGDSTMANKSLKNGNIERGWGQMLPGYFTEEVVVDNHAMNGRSSLSFINEGRWDIVLSKIHKGDYVFIQFGHNDEKPRATLHTEPGSTFDDNLRRFVNETRAKGGNPVLFNSIVRRNFLPKGVTEIKGSYEKEGPVLVDTHGEYLESPRRVAGEMNVPFIDLNKLTHDLVTGMGVENSRKLFMWIPAGQYEFCPEGKIDNTHLNIYGGRIVAGLVVDALMEEVPALAKYVRRYDYVVAKDGSGDFFTVQEAVNVAVGGGKKTISILVRPGVYEEYVSMPESSPRIELVKQTGAEIRDNGFTQDVYVAPYKGDRVCAISYTFDDGLQEHYTLLFPKLEKYGFKGTFWIWGKCIENESAMQGKPRMSWAQIKEMSDKGQEISSHSWSHTNLKRVSLEEVKMEVEKNDSILYEKTGKIPRTFCYPFNAVNSDILKITSKNRVGTRTEQYPIGGDKSKSTPESLDKWVESLVNSGRWGVAMIHGISQGYDAFLNPEILWEHFSKVKALENKIWVGTFREVAAYTKEREKIRLNVLEKENGYNITPHLDMNAQLFTEPLTMVLKSVGNRVSEIRQDGKKLFLKKDADKILFDFNPYGGMIQIRFI